MKKISLLIALVFAFSGHAVLAADGMMQNDMKMQPQNGSMMKKDSGMMKQNDAMMNGKHTSKKKAMHTRHGHNMGKKSMKKKSMDKM